jgi:2-succinyl-6-hydroxy-2,4-cyclohexadiene-1-carboxylate synthase
MILHAESSGDGPPVTLLHGFTAHGGAWDEIRARLEPRFRVLTVDLPGHGRSPAPPRGYDFAACAADVVATMRAHRQTPGALLGYSMGGRIALAAALRAADAIDRLILESASPGLAAAEDRADRRAADAALARRIEAENWAGFIDRWLAQPLFRTLRGVDPAALARNRALRLANDPTAVAAALRCLGTGSQPSYWQQLATLRQPVLLINGERDEKFEDIAARMQRLLPASRRCVVPGAGHTTHLENPAVFSDAVVDFLATPRGAVAVDSGATP